MNLAPRFKLDIVPAEIAKWEASGDLRAASWRVIGEDELPVYDSATRNAWVDDGAKITVDPTKIKPKPPTLEARIAALEATRT